MTNDQIKIVADGLRAASIHRQMVRECIKEVLDVEGNLELDGNLWSLASLLDVMPDDTFATIEKTNDGKVIIRLKNAPV